MRSTGRVLGWTALAGLLCAQSIAPGPQVLAFHSDVDDSSQPYALYVPDAYTPAEKYPLVLSLHGAWSNHRLNLRRVFGKGNLPGETDAQASRYFPPFRKVNYLVVSPFARGTMGYEGIAEKDVYDVLADVQRRYSVDPERIYLTGLSMGGGGTLYLGLSNPSLWAAIAPVCPAAPPAAEELAANALGLPVHLYQGEIDPLVPAASTRRWHKRLLEAGAKVEYNEYPNVRHNAWDYAYANGAVFDWFNQFRREPFPARVRFAARQYRHGSAWWVRLLKITPGELAHIDAAFTGPNTLRITTDHLDAFTLTLGGHPQIRPKQPVRLQIDGAPVKAALTASTTLTFARRAGNWTQVPAYVPAADEKTLGREGPIAEAVASAHIYVYGTKDSPAPEELLRRQADAEKAADWSTPQSKLSLKTRILSDHEITPSDRAQANLVLFGTRDTNSEIAALASPPIALNTSAADYGLFYIIPTTPGHYALVSSGLPWWTNAAQSQRPGLFFVSPQVRLLQSFPDYLLFRGSITNVVQEGYFDDHWRIPAAVRETLQATGAVRF